VAAVRAITNGAGADVALDAVGGDSSKQTIRAVRDGGRLAELTFEKLPAERGITIVHVHSEPSAARLETLGAMYDAGQIKAQVFASFPLARARDAQEAISHPHAPGEVVLSVD
jgi:NADPH:quinone reductase-like Zn-dependent oxidoreductase